MGKVISPLISSHCVVIPTGMKRALAVLVLLSAVGGASAQSLNSKATKAFASKVQPILSNVCASCHAGKDHASEFKLKRYDPNFNEPAVAESNLKALEKYLSADEPQSSPVLKYAILAHGKAKEPPLKDAAQPAFRNLELWVHWAGAAEGTPELKSVPPAVKLKMEKPAPVVVQAEARESVKAPATVIQAGFGSSKPVEVPKSNPNDPFDPAPFNKK